MHHLSSFKGFFYCTIRLEARLWDIFADTHSAVCCENVGLTSEQLE